MVIWIIVALLGLCVGSFLNVVIYRLPIILDQAENIKFSLSLPDSHCPHCKKTLPWRHNIPVISYLLLRGRCAFCQQKIPWRYPVVEIMSLVITLFLYSHFGLTLQFAASLLFSWILLALIMIDFDKQLLPDILTLSLLWLGLLASTQSLFAQSADAIIGASLGYLFLWLIAKAYQFFTKREGMGYGDFKLLAALGAWAGWEGILPIILIASISGAVVGIILLLTKRTDTRMPIAFGPYLALGGWLVLLWGNQLTQWWLG